MNWTIIIIEAIVMTIAFTAMVLIPLVKNPLWWIHDYPEVIQEEYFKCSASFRNLGQRQTESLSLLSRS